MKRREVVATVPVVLSGFVGTPGRGGESHRETTVEAVVDAKGRGYSFDVDVTQSATSDAVASLHFELENTGEERVWISAGPPRPFGKLIASAEDAESALVLWSEAYGESGHVRTDGYHVEFWTEPVLGTGLSPGASVESTYTVRRDASIGSLATQIRDGTYRVYQHDGSPFEIDGEPVDVKLRIDGSGP